MSLQIDRRLGEERLGFRVDEPTKALIERAAQLERRKLTDFCMTALTDRGTFDEQRQNAWRSDEQGKHSLLRITDVLDDTRLNLRWSEQKAALGF